MSSFLLERQFPHSKAFFDAANGTVTLAGTSSDLWTSGSAPSAKPPIRAIKAQQPVPRDPISESF